MKINFYPSKIAGIENTIKKCLKKTADAVKTDVQQSETMPFDTGALQNRSTFVDSSKVSDYSVSVVSDTPYARRLYFHPEYNFRQDKNPNAGGEWFEPYISGEKKDYIKKVFANFMRSSL